MSLHEQRRTKQCESQNKQGTPLFHWNKTSSEIFKKVTKTDLKQHLSEIFRIARNLINFKILLTSVISSRGFENYD